MMKTVSKIIQKVPFDEYLFMKSLDNHTSEAVLACR